MTSPSNRFPGFLSNRGRGRRGLGLGLVLVLGSVRGLGTAEAGNKLCLVPQRRSLCVYGLHLTAFTWDLH